MTPEEYEAQRWRIDHPELVIVLVVATLVILAHLWSPSIRAALCRVPGVGHVALKVVDYAAGGDGRCE